MPYDDVEANHKCFNKIIHWFTKCISEMDAVTIEIDRNVQSVKIQGKPGASVEVAMDDWKLVQ